jgi:hypothetical protein
MAMGMLTIAMAGEKKQEKKRLEEVETPKRVRRPEKTIIGSSSTWKQKELDKFRVIVQERDVRDMIPEKWFDFGGLEHHQSSNPVTLFHANVARGDLVQVQPEDLLDDNALLEKATHFYTVFTNVQSLQNLRITDSRMKNLSGKRGKSRMLSALPLPLISHTAAERAGRIPPQQTADETQRAASISDLSMSSAGTKFFHACQERESETLANILFSVALRRIYRKDPAVGWAIGRHDLPTLKWRSRY